MVDGGPTQGAAKSRASLPVGLPTVDFGTCPEVKVVTPFTPALYTGDWYAAYANPTWFQSEATSCSRARYSLNDDGTVGVFNSGQGGDSIETILA